MGGASMLAFLQHLFGLMPQQFLQTLHSGYTASCPEWKDTGKGLNDSRPAPHTALDLHPWVWGFGFRDYCFALWVPVNVSGFMSG